jgi:hypothetical protein
MCVQHYIAWKLNQAFLGVRLAKGTALLFCGLYSNSTLSSKHRIAILGAGELQVLNFW